MLSYWEQQSLVQYDCIVLGSGIVGLSAAINIRERFPHKRVLVLERGLLPAGASTRNAGFACIGSLTEILDDLQQMPEKDVVSLVQLRRKGLQLLRARIGDERMDYAERGSYELISDAELPALNEMDKVNAMLGSILPGPAFTLSEKRFGFNGVRAMVHNHFEGELHTGKMMRTLISLAAERGVEIKTGCEVTGFEEDADGVTVAVPGIMFKAAQLIVCTNAFTPKLIPGLDVEPGRGQVIVTGPIKNLPFKGIYHFDRGYYYFRELEGRILFGGGRNQDFEGEHTDQFGLSDRIQQNLEEKLRTLIIPGIPFTITHRWSGIMAFGRNKQPIIRRHSSRIFLAVRMGGMGIAIGSEAGRMVAAMID